MTKAKTKLGRIYKKWNVRPDGTRVEHTTWTVRYKGTDYATGETDHKRAENFLLKKAGAIATDPRKAGNERKVSMAEIFDRGLADARRQGNKTAEEVESKNRLYLKPFFEKMNAAKLTTDDVNAYIDWRLDAEPARATINKELAMLKHALILAVDNEPPLIMRRPKFKMLDGCKIRKNFLNYGGYAAIKAKLPEHLISLFVTAYHCGCRRGELTQVELQDIDMEASQPQFRLWPDATKNGEGRLIPIYGEMVAVFRDQIALSRRHSCRWLFNNEGEQVLTFYKAWKTAVKAAGFEGLLFHDLRRTAVRNLVRAGVSRKIAMDISGHKTEDVFERYNITDERDIEEAAIKMSTFISAQFASYRRGIEASAAA